MNDLTQSRLASALALIAGAWVVLSPIWISITGGALTNILISGAVIAVLAGVQMFLKSTWPSWLMAIAAIWLFVSAFMFGMSDAATWSAALSAIATFVLANWDGFELAHFNERHHTSAI